MSLSKVFGAAVAAICVAGTAQGAPREILQNHVPEAVSQSRRIGALTPTTNLNLSIGLPLRNRQELDRLVEQISDATSPLYRHYLTTADFTERFGPTQADYDKLTAFVQAKGFKVAATHPNRLILDVTGPVSAVTKTFHVGINVWEHSKRGTFFAPDRDPWLDLDVDVLTISGLDNYVVPKPADVKAQAIANVKSLTTGSGPSGLYIGNDFRAAYAPGVGLSGTGQTIGLLEFDGFYASDLTANFKAAKMTAPTVTTVLLNEFSGSAGFNNIEVILDIVMAGYMAPGAKIISYEGYSPDSILNRMATDNLAQQLSCSWSFGIDSMSEQIFLEMIAQGQTFLTASGDSGAYSNGISAPADDPNVTSVGGTSLLTSGAGGRWLSEAAWSGSGGGVSTKYSIPSYQTAVNMAAIGGSTTMRNIPDVALTADIQMYLIYNRGAATSVGGTSAATPLWGGFIALANEQAAANAKPPIGFLNPAIYAVGGGSNYNSDLHDIITGNTGFSAWPGYDLTTGWGSPAGQSLIDDLTATPSPSFAINTAPNGSASLVAASSTKVTVQVAGQIGFAGSVTLSATGLPPGVTASFGAITSGSSTLTLTASSTATPGSYPIAIQGISGSLAASAGLTLQVTPPPTFTLQTSAASVSEGQGSTGTTAIAISPQNGFTGTVKLAVSGLPNGVTASFSPASTTSASTLSLTASITAAVGTANVTVTGTSGSLTSSVSVPLTVIQVTPYSLSASNPAPSVVQSASTTNAIAITRKAGFSSYVALTVSGLPNGVTGTFSPASAYSSSNLTFAATSSAPLGTYPLIVTGTVGTWSATTAISLTVNPAPSFTLASAQSTLSIVQGTKGTSVFTLTPLNGFNKTATLAIGGLPTGVTASFSPSSIGTTSTLTLTASTTAALGSATVTVTATSGTISAQATIALTVTAAPGFSLASSPASVTVAAGSTGTTTITISAVGGFSSSVALSASGLPSGVTASFSPANATSTSTLTLTASKTAAAAATKITLKGTSGSITSTLSLPITVTAAQAAH
jgi:uncharacterized membrane protein